MNKELKNTSSDNFSASAAKTPKEIVAYLDRFIIGQTEAKKAVAIALRNRYRRKAVDENFRDEILPKNILMIGPTGVGKTEIARRLAKLVGAPFIKVEATKFTEVGYVGRDVESIIRDLVDFAINMYKNEATKAVHKQAERAAIYRVLEVLVGENASDDTKGKFYEKLINGQLDDQVIEIKVQPSQSGNSSFEIPGMPGASMGVLNISDMLGKAFGGEKLVEKKMAVKDAMRLITAEEAESLIDEDQITHQAITAVQEDGIVFLDEIDKIASKDNARGGEVSREGVQRDLLPLIEGTNVTTKHGTVKTDHILFVASGAFHVSKPSNLLPELQGRLPIRVKLSDLSHDDMVRILTEPEANLIKQYDALLQTEGLTLKWHKDAIAQLAEIAIRLNKEVENIGARRLHGLIEKLLEDLSFNASDMEEKEFTIDQKYVQAQVKDAAKPKDLANFIL